MTDDRSPDIDRQIREAYEPDARSAARVAAGALAAAAGPRRRWLAIAAAGAVVVLAGSLAFWPSHGSGPDRQPADVGSASLTGSFTDGVLVVTLPDGSISILGGDARDDRPPDGYGIVLVEGELR